MTVYLIFKSLIMMAALAFAFGYFSKRVARLYKIMEAVDGDPGPPPNRLATRIKVLFTDVLGQSNVRRKFAPGMAHTLIFFGFLAIQPHSLELMLRGVIPSLNLGHVFPGLYTFYLFAADILGFFVLVGFAYALYRRLVIRPDYLTMGRDANLIILFTCVIVLSFHFINAFAMVMEPADGFPYAAAFPVSGVFASIFGINGLGQADLNFGYEFFYFIHIGTILGFLIYIPGSKHLHLLAAAPNVFFKRLETPKAIVKTDIEDEEAETFGLGKCSEFNWHNVLNLYACTECGRCEEQCPADMTGKPLSPKRVIQDTKYDLFDQSRSILAKDYDSVVPLVQDASPISQDVLWSCTTCRACEDICPVDIQHLDIILEARKYQVLMEASFPAEMQETFTSLENQSNPWGFGSDARGDWAKGLDVALMTDTPDADILYFVGCAGSFDDRGKKIARAMAHVLKKAGVNFAILGEEERCNGDLARRAGNEYLAQMMIMQNVETLSQYEFDTIITGCPHCYNTLKNDYPDFEGQYRVVHTAEFFNTLIKTGQLNVSAKDFGRITFHDSCYLGRWNGIYDAPRQVIEAIPGAQLTELDRNGQTAFCCGAGGGRFWMEEESPRVNEIRAKEISDRLPANDGVAALNCPFCTTMITDGLKAIDVTVDGETIDRSEQVQVLDIAEMIAARLPDDEPTEEADAE